MDRRNFIKTGAIFIALVKPGSHLFAKTYEIDFRSVDKSKVEWLGSNPDCVVCGMSIDQFYKTTHAADINGKTYQYCSINCMFNHAFENKLQEPVNPRVVDISSLKYIDANTAFYVLGSNKPGTMSPVSTYAFRKEGDAIKFSKEFGGEVINYSKASKHAKNEIAQWAAIHEKRRKNSQSRGEGVKRDGRGRRSNQEF